MVSKFVNHCDSEKPVKRMKKRLVGKKKSLIEQQMALTQNEDIDDEEFDVEGKEDLVSEYFGPWQVEPYQPGVAMVEFTSYLFLTLIPPSLKFHSRYPNSLFTPFFTLCAWDNSLLFSSERDGSEE